MSERNHNPLAYLDQVYEELKPTLSFSATNVQDWRLWRDALRAKVIELLGGFPDRRCDLEPEVVETVQMDGYRREKITIRSEPGYRVPLYFLVPDGIEGPSPTVVALHGHGAGVMEICGIALSEAMQEHIRAHNYDYAVQAAKHGYVVVAPDQRGFGACRAPEDVAADPFRSSCRQMSFNAMMMGKTAIGMRVWDVMRCIDYAEMREESDADRIACMGLSGGGTVTLFSSALEERIKVAVVSGYFNTFRDCIMAMQHCECNYVPGILRYGEMYDVAGLIAPRPLLIESGTEDTIFPVEAAEYAFERVKRIYDLLGVPERLDKDIFEGPHRFSGRKAFDWLKRWLMSNEE